MTWTMSVWCSGGCRLSCSALNSSEPGADAVDLDARGELLRVAELLLNVLGERLR